MSEQLPLNELLTKLFPAPPPKTADAPTVGAVRRVAPVVGELCRIGLVSEMRAIDEANRTIDFVSSTEATDRYGDIIRVKGWQTANYLLNPVFLFQHRSNEPPIGKTIKLWTESSPAPALVQRVQFADAKTYPFAETIFRLYQGKFMNATSVGFKPLEDPTPIRNAEGQSTGGYEFTKQELLELSAVAIPANPEALARTLHRAFDEGVITKSAEDEATKSFLDAFQNPSWSQSVPGVTYAVEEPVAAKKDRATTADYLALIFALGKLTHAAQWYEALIRDSAANAAVASPEDLARVLGIWARDEISSVDDIDQLERLFRLG